MASKVIGAERRKQVEEDTRNGQRTFELNGETFTMRPSVRPEALTGYDQITADTPVTETLPIIDGLIKAFIVRDDHDKWDRIRADEDNPVDILDLQETVEWLMETVTGRIPTQQPVPSTDSPPTTGTTSTDGSFSPDTLEQTRLTSVS